MQVFADAVKLSKNPVCYNGNIFTIQDYKNFITSFPMVTAVMMGRGIIMNPGLADEIRYEKNVEKQQLREFHDTLFARYQEVIPGERNVLFKMKEVWSYMICLFPDSEKCGKKIKKASQLTEYEKSVDQLFEKNW